jgi:GrpB-like predicted nucleotidyltransferase (UPF0157 family)
MTLQLDEPIEIVAYDPAWARAFERERVSLQPAFADSLAALEHIGSTAVAGMDAKPIVDLMAALKNYPASPATLLALAALGYEDLGEAGVPGRQYLRKRGGQAFNLHLVVSGGAHWRNNLLLRDYLRAQPAEAANYARHKRQLFAAGRTTLLAYSDGKTALLGELLQRAAQWQVKV